jgi:mRNA-degrading endonuclease RelE of RelBE toxin-antitoxin system
VPVRGPARRGWPDVTETAWREFLSLPPEVQDRLVAAFPEFVGHPTRPSPTQNVVPVRGDPVRWRLKIPEYRVLFQIRHGRALVEEIEPRTGSTYVRFGRYAAAHSRKR